jgi:hypothetical protein
MDDQDNIENEYLVTVEFLVSAATQEEAEEIAWNYARIRIPKKYVDRIIQPDHVFKPDLAN